MSKKTELAKVEKRRRVKPAKHKRVGRPNLAFPLLTGDTGGMFWPSSIGLILDIAFGPLIAPKGCRNPPAPIVFACDACRAELRPCGMVPTALPFCPHLPGEDASDFRPARHPAYRRQMRGIRTAGNRSARGGSRYG
jgi:hypothetical protein